ncbi:MAG: elongation factor 1-beta [Candidatus Micrarchaeota archaeon]|jgi:translation elongation factor EF-1beta
MGKVGVVFKVYPENGEEEKVSKRIAEALKPNGIQLEDIAFGIKVIKVLFIHEDTEGSSVFEEKLKNIEGVKEVEVEEESLL